MTARITGFDARAGGSYHLELRYTDGAGRGKSTPDSDIVSVRFVELIPDELIIEAAEFESDDPANAGTTRLMPINGGTKVSITASDVPARISEEDHRAGMVSSLRNLALLLE